MKRITIIDGHPDPSERHLNHALAERYATVASSAGAQIRRVDVARLDFPVMRDPDDFYNGKPVAAIEQAQHDIKWADHIVMFYPLWDGDMPALLKAFIEQTFRPGFALAYGGRTGFPKPLLRGKSARIVITMGMPAVFYRWYFGAHALKGLEKSVLGFAGVRPIREKLIGGVGEVSEKRRRRWVESMDSVAAQDLRPERRKVHPLRVFLGAGALLAGAYAAYVATAWSQYGKTNKQSPDRDRLLDRAMAEYEVSVHHGIAVNAPADVTFEALRTADFQRSPIVRGLLRSREALLHASHVDVRLPNTLLDQMKSLGWTVLAQTPMRELVLGTATQPWKPNPVFRQIPAEEFGNFSEPGYAKIALTLRVDDVNAEQCEVRTETRVMTTDRVSREKFRRYWALLSPGIALIRMVLLQQVKADAEHRAVTLAT